MNPECKSPPALGSDGREFASAPTAGAEWTTRPQDRARLRSPDTGGLPRRAAGARDEEFLPLVAARLGAVGSWILDTRTMEISWSHEFLEMCGFARTPPPTLRRVLSIVSSESQDAARSAFETLLGGQDIVQIDLRATSETGRPMWLRVTAEPVRRNGGSLTRVRGAVQDVSELKQFESAAERATTELALLVEHLSEAVITVARDGKFLFLNGAAERLLHRSRRDLIGRLAYEEYPRLAGSRYHAHFLRVALEHGTSAFETYAIELGKWLRITMFASPRGVTAVVRASNTKHGQPHGDKFA